MLYSNYEFIQHDSHVIAMQIVAITSGIEIHKGNKSKDAKHLTIITDASFIGESGRRARMTTLNGYFIGLSYSEQYFAYFGLDLLYNTQLIVNVCLHS
jgi:hypothetical protein